VGHQRVYPFDRHRNCASAEGMVGHEIIAKPRQNASCWQCRERRLGQVGFAHHTFRPRPPSHHTVFDVTKPCFDAVTKHRRDTTISLRGLCTCTQSILTSSMCFSPDGTCCFLKRLVFFKQQICDNVCAVYMPALHANDKEK